MRNLSPLENMRVGYTFDTTFKIVSNIPKSWQILATPEYGIASQFIKSTLPVDKNAVHCVPLKL